MWCIHSVLYESLFIEQESLEIQLHAILASAFDAAKSISLDPINWGGSGIWSNTFWIPPWKTGRRERGVLLGDASLQIEDSLAKSFISAGLGTPQH